jgi:hypothetical protein
VDAGCRFTGLWGGMAARGAVHAAGVRIDGPVDIAAIHPRAPEQKIFISVIRNGLHWPKGRCIQ